jgi:predicted metalloprotease with PDZ domain
MSRSSAGRYAAFEFAKNVFEERFTDTKGQPLQVKRLSPREWEIVRHGPNVRVTYKIFGDRVDGTFLAIDTTHAHINPPAALMWAHGMVGGAARVTFMLPSSSSWRVATQLYPTKNPTIFTAPNLQYLMDSPIELSDFEMRAFTVPPLMRGGKTQTIRVAVHRVIAPGDLDEYAKAFERVVLEEQAIFGELPDFEPGSYTLIVDYVPWAEYSGMEHRNSSVITSRSVLVKDGVPLVRTPTHEFFHVWNVKRIRPASLEPFDFSDVNTCGELWLAEGFTNYYERLVLMRSGLQPNKVIFGEEIAGELGYVLNSPSRRIRSAVDDSRLAPFVDARGGPLSDPTDWENTFISYYSYGDMLALGLDLSLRGRSGSHVTLDDFMRAMWKSHGKPIAPAPGLVAKPYTLQDVRARLAEVSGDWNFANDFVHRYIEGTERLDYAPLLLQAGFLLRKKHPGAGSLGAIHLEDVAGTSPRVVSPTRVGSAAYAAGLDEGDELISVGGIRIDSEKDLPKAMLGHKAGEEVELVFKRRGQEVHTKTTLAEDEQLELIPIERDGGTLTPEQQRFRDAWLGSRVRQR